MSPGWAVTREICLVTVMSAPGASTGTSTCSGSRSAMVNAWPNEAGVISNAPPPGLCNSASAAGDAFDGAM